MYTCHLKILSLHKLGSPKIPAKFLISSINVIDIMRVMRVDKFIIHLWWDVEKGVVKNKGIKNMDGFSFYNSHFRLNMALSTTSAYFR